MFSTMYMLCCVYVLLLCLKFTRADDEGGSEHPLKIGFIISEDMKCKNVYKNPVMVQEGSNMLLVAKSKIGPIKSHTCYVNDHLIDLNKSTNISTKHKSVVTIHMEKHLAGEWKCSLLIQHKLVNCSVTVNMLKREKEHPRGMYSATQRNWKWRHRRSLPTDGATSKKDPEAKIIFDANDDPCMNKQGKTVTLTNGEKFVLEIRGHELNNARCTKDNYFNKKSILSNTTFKLQPNNNVSRVVLDAEMYMNGIWSCFFNEWAGQRRVKCYAEIIVKENEKGSSKDKTNQHNNNNEQQKTNGSNKGKETNAPIPVWGIIVIAVVGFALLIVQSLVILYLVIKRRKGRAPNSLQAISSGGTDTGLNREKPRYSLLPRQRKRIEQPVEVAEYETVECPPASPQDEDQPIYEDGAALIQDPHPCFNSLPRSRNYSPDKTPPMSRPLPQPPRRLDHLGLETAPALRENHQRRCRVRSGSVDQLELLRNEVETSLGGNTLVSELKGKLFTQKPAPQLPPKPLIPTKSFKIVKSPHEITKWPPSTDTRAPIPLPEEAFRSLPRRVLPANPSLPHTQLLPKDNIPDSESVKPNSTLRPRKTFTPSSPRMPLKTARNRSQSIAEKIQSLEKQMPAISTKLLPGNMSTKMAQTTLPKVKPLVPKKSVIAQLSLKNQTPNTLTSTIEELREKKGINEKKTQVPPPLSTHIGLDRTRSGPSRPIMNQPDTSTKPLPPLTPDNSDYEPIGDSDTDEYWDYEELPKNIYNNVDLASS